MEGLGSHYVVLLHDPQLRKSLAVRDDRPTTPDKASNAAGGMRVWLARFLHAVAAHIEPAVSSSVGAELASISSELAQAQPLEELR